MSILVKKAEKFAKQKDFATAYKLLLEANAKGSSEAGYALGTWYLFGRFVKKDLHKAVAYLIRSAEKGNVNAMFNLAVCYEKGAGVNRNLEKAFEYYFRAFNNGDFDAAYEVGRMFYYGLGVAKNTVAAESFIKLGKYKKLPIKKHSVYSRPAKSPSFQFV